MESTHTADHVKENITYLSPVNWTTTVTRYNVSQWREYLKLELIHKRHYKSDFSRKPLSLSSGCHMHEGILSRANVPRSLHWHALIFDERNVLLLLPEEHIPTPPSRDWAIHYLYDMYGRDVIKDWYESLPFKSFPFQLP